jgi:uncharacterized protein (DUF427 family)
MKVYIGDKLIASASKDELIFIEGNWYFPPSLVDMTLLQKSPTPYTCPWKGVCQYYTAVIGDVTYEDVCWSYPEPLPIALERVKKDFAGYVAFWRDAKITEE